MPCLSWGGRGQPLFAKAPASYFSPPPPPVLSKCKNAPHCNVTVSPTPSAVQPLPICLAFIVPVVGRELLEAKPAGTPLPLPPTPPPTPTPFSSASPTLPGSPPGPYLALGKPHFPGNMCPVPFGGGRRRREHCLVPCKQDAKLLTVPQDSPLSNLWGSPKSHQEAYQLEENNCMRVAGLFYACLPIEC